MTDSQNKDQDVAAPDSPPCQGRSDRIVGFLFSVVSTTLTQPTLRLFR
jgi:hypothetical protein